MGHMPTGPTPTADASGDADELLAAVIADPDADAPRLAYADWLQRKGDPVAAGYVRAAVELPTLPPGSPRRVEVFHRLDTLERARNAWVEAKLLPGAGYVVRRRGFHEVLFIDPPDLVRHADELFRRGPIRDVTFDAADPADLAAALALPQMARIRALTVNHKDPPAGFGDAVAEAIAVAPSLVSLRTLHLYRLNLKAQGAAAIAGCPALATLEELSLHANPLGSKGAVALAASPHLRRLRLLNLEVCDIGPGGAKALAGSPVLASVRQLKLGGQLAEVYGRCGGQNVVRDAGAAALARSAGVGALELLDLSRAGIGDAGARALARSPNLAALGRLILARNDVGDAGAAALAKSATLPALRRLDLTQNAIREAGARALADAPGLPALEVLGLGGNDLWEAELRVWTEEDGTAGGASRVRMETRELQARYGKRFRIE
jgi:uncharacterized protein (TIGR02996 family)